MQVDKPFQEVVEYIILLMIFKKQPKYMKLIPEDPLPC